jgi:UDP-N-acetylmuramate dehydrogenase
MPFKKQLEAMYQAFRASGIECKWNESLASHTTFHIGGQAALAVWPASRAQLIQVLSFWRELGEKCPLCILGKGSNVLIPDSGYGGLVVITTRAKRVVFEEDECPDREAFRQEHVYCQVYAECGASLTGLAYTCGDPERALSGLEFAYGIPGTVGGATVMNAGAYGSDMERVLVSSEYYDLSNGRIVRLNDTEMELDYRHSVYLDHPEWIVLSSVMTLSYGNAFDIHGRMEFNMASRTEKQPLEYPSAGSVFKRPVENYAGRMVETVGLKGFSIGGAQVSEKHAGFIINRDHATASDVIALVRRVREAVEEVYHYRLECEIRLISDGITPNQDSEW